MRNIIALICILFLSGCYSYQVYNPETDGENKSLENNSTKLNSVRSNSNSKNTIIENQTEILNLKPKDIIKEKEFYQFKVFTRESKVQAVKWEGDTLIATLKSNPSKTLKVHENDIQDLKVRKFSKGRSDALTVTGYVAAGVGVLLLLK